MTRSNDDLAEAIRQLRTSDAFCQSPRLCELLNFLVARTAAGESLKESVIGVELYGRRPDYDPRSDPIVRTEVRRLRLKLAEYYLGEGAPDSIRVEIPKGGYRLVFSPIASSPNGTAVAEKSQRRWLPYASVLVMLAIGFLAWRNPKHLAANSGQRKYAARDASVQDLYLQAKQLWRTRQEPDVRKAIALFEQCTRKEPGYVWPYIGLADSYAQLAANSLALPAEVLPKAESAALRAIELSPDLAEVHLSVGYIRYCQWDWINAEAEYAKARRLNPALPLAFFRSSVVSLALGRFDEALSLLEEGRVLDPFSPLFGSAISEAYYYKRDYVRAAEAARRLKALDSLASHLLLAKALWQLHDPNWKAEWIEMMNVPASAFQQRLRAVWLNLDNPEKGRRQLQAVLRDPGRDASPWQLAETAARFQENEESWKWLDAAVRSKQPDVVSVQWDPAFDEMRREPRYARLLARMGLPAPTQQASAMKGDSSAMVAPPL